MTEQDTIIRQIHIGATKQGASFGDGGKAAAAFYEREQPDVETLLYMLAVATNNITMYRQRSEA